MQYLGSFSFGSAKTGLVADLRLQPKKIDGTNTGPVLSGVFFEIGGGVYNVAATIPDDSTHVVITCTSDAAVIGSGVAVQGLTSAEFNNVFDATRLAKIDDAQQSDDPVELPDPAPTGYGGSAVEYSGKGTSYSGRPV